MIKYLWIFILFAWLLAACKGAASMSEIDYSKFFSTETDVALIKAISANDVATIKRLAHKGANLSAVGEHENTPLRVALKLKRKEVVKLLLQLGVNPNSTTPKGTVAAADDAVVEKDPYYLQLFLEYGLDPNLTCEEVPLIFYAVSRSNWQQYEMLLISGADINSKAPDGSSLLMDLVMQFEYDRAKELLIRGADVSVKDRLGFTILDQLVEDQRRFCGEPGLVDCEKRAELLRLMEQRGVKVPGGLPYM